MDPWGSGCPLETQTPPWEEDPRCGLGCRVCCSVLVLNSLGWGCPLLLGSPPSCGSAGSRRDPRPLQLQSSAEVAPGTLPEPEVALQHLEKKLLEILTVAIQHATGLQVGPRLSRKLGWNTDRRHHTYLSCNFFDTALKAKTFHFIGVQSCQV